MHKKIESFEKEVQGLLDKYGFEKEVDITITLNDDMLEELRNDDNFKLSYMKYSYNRESRLVATYDNIHIQRTLKEWRIVA